MPAKFQIGRLRLSPSTVDLGSTGAVLGILATPVSGRALRVRQEPFGDIAVQPALLFVDRYRFCPMSCDHAHAENCERDTHQLLPAQGLAVKQRAYGQAENRDQKTECVRPVERRFLQHGDPYPIDECRAEKAETEKSPNECGRPLDRGRLFHDPGTESKWDAADQHLEPHGHEGINVAGDPFDEHITDGNSEGSENYIGHADNIVFLPAREKLRGGNDENP